MASLFPVVRFLSEMLQVSEIPDASNNGLQVEGDADVAKIAFAVDACMETFEKAKQAGANFLVVHHGISWADSLKYVTSVNRSRLQFLLRHGMSLYAAHLPLDRHSDYGNNVQLFKMLGLGSTLPFGYSSGVSIGLMGEFAAWKDVEEVAALLQKQLQHKPCTWNFGKRQVSKVAVVSGSGGGELAEAIARGADLFVTGEVHHSSYHLARDGKINVIAAGHYATETLGLKALMAAVQQKFNIPTVFIDADTGL